jgi:hypothetical protein
LNYLVSSSPSQSCQTILPGAFVPSFVNPHAEINSPSLRYLPVVTFFPQDLNRLATNGRPSSIISHKVECSNGHSTATASRQPMPPTLQQFQLVFVNRQSSLRVLVTFNFRHMTPYPATRNVSEDRIALPSSKPPTLVPTFQGLTLLIFLRTCNYWQANIIPGLICYEGSNLHSSEKEHRFLSRTTRAFSAFLSRHPSLRATSDESALTRVASGAIFSNCGHWFPHFVV